MATLEVISWYLLIGMIWTACLETLAYTLRHHLKMDWVAQMTNTLRIINILLWPLCIIVFTTSYFKERK